MNLNKLTASNPAILAMLHSYWPGNEATGPVRSLTAMLEVLSKRFDFCLMAQRKARGQPLPTALQWHALAHGQVCYFDTGVAGARGLSRVLRETTHDLVYLNSFFDHIFTIPTLVMRQRGNVPRRPVLIAPRGEFAQAALAHSPLRKKAYLAFGRSTGLFDDIWLHATAEHEIEDLLRFGFAESQVLLAPDARTLPQPPLSPLGARDAKAPLRLTFVGRLTPMKNIDFAFQVLSHVHSPIEFDIYGPVADTGYWSKCEEMARRLPPHVRVTAKGLLAHNAVIDVLSGYDLFFLPSRGENFSHAIFEALAAGLPVLTSDRTPWTDLEACSCGWSLSLDQPQAFANVIDEVWAQSTTQRSAMRQAARQRAERDFAESDVVGMTVAMFETVMREAQFES